MKINPSIFKSYDIRGLYPTELDKESAGRIAHAIYTFFKNNSSDNLSIVVGRDMRISSPEIHEHVCNTLSSLGCTVVDIGLATTPTVYFTVIDKKYNGGIQISASHNPAQYNGLKIVKREGSKIIKIGSTTGMDKVKALSISGTLCEINNKGTILHDNTALDREVEAAYSSVKPTINSGIKIVVDAANAMGSPMIEALLKRTDVSIVWMNKELDGTFPSHQADPLQFGLWSELQKRVVSEHADFGIMPDGDGDRVLFVNEKGQIISATLITSLLVKEILEIHPEEKIIVDIRYLRNVEAVCKKYAGKMSISSVGHALITEQLNKENAYFAGESSGHYYFRATGGAESSIRVILHLLNALSKSGKPISQLLEEFQTSFESGERNFDLPSDTNSLKIMDYLHHEYKDGLYMDLDGIAISFPAWRFSVRSSNTEPLLRLNVEGASEQLVSSKFLELTQKILSFGAKVKE